MKRAWAFIIPKGLFNWSLLISVVSLLLLSPFSEALPIMPWFAQIVYYFDLVQLLSFLVTLVLLSKWIKTLKPTSITAPILVAFIVVLLFAFETKFVGDSFGVNFFGFEKPVSPFEEPLITKWIKQFETGSPYNSAPSDFVIRQWIILLMGCFAAGQPQLRFKGKTTLKIFLSISVIYVVFGRLFRLAHTPIDVAISIVLATFMFWSTILLIAIVTGVPIDVDIKSRYSILCLLSIAFFMLVSNNPVAWVYLIFAFPLIVWTIVRLAEKYIHM